MSDLIINVRQIGNYADAVRVLPDDTFLLQRGGLGGPYVKSTAQSFVSTALENGGNLYVGVTAPPDAAPFGQVFTNELVMPCDGSLMWNAYYNSVSTQAYLGNGPAGMLWFDCSTGTLTLQGATPGTTGSEIAWNDLLTIGNDGVVLLNQDATEPMQPVTFRQFQQALGSEGIGASVSPTPPADPYPGMFWFDPVNPNLYVWYDDGTSAQWVIAVNNGIPDAPSDGVPYVRMDGDWAALDLSDYVSSDELQTAIGSIDLSGLFPVTGGELTPLSEGGVGLSIAADASGPGIFIAASGTGPAIRVQQGTYGGGNDRFVVTNEGAVEIYRPDSTVALTINAGIAMSINGTIQMDETARQSLQTLLGIPVT